MENQPTNSENETEEIILNTDPTPSHDIAITLTIQNITTAHGNLSTTDSIQNWTTALNIDEPKDKKTLRGIRREFRKSAMEGKTLIRKWGTLTFTMNIGTEEETTKE